MVPLAAGTSYSSSSCPFCAPEHVRCGRCLGIYFLWHAAGSVLKIFDSIKSQPLDLETSPWPLVSQEAKGLLRRMLERDPAKRPTAAQLLGESPSGHCSSGVFACLLTGPGTLGSWR